MQKQISPSLPHVRNCSARSEIVFPGSIFAPTGGLVMPKLCERCVEVTVAKFLDPKTQVYIIIRDGKVLVVKPTRLKENLLSHDHARGGNRTVIANKPGAVVVSASVAVEFVQNMACRSAQPQHDARMLQRPIGK